MINKKLFLAFVICIFGISVYGAEYSMQDIFKLRNDKEVVITVFDGDEKDDILKRFSSSIEINRIDQIFRKSILDFVNNSSFRCDLNLISKIKDALGNEGIPNHKEDIESYLKLLRSYHFIDDIFYEFVQISNTDFHKLQEIDLTNYTFSSKTKKKWNKLRSKKTIVRNAKDLLAKNDISNLYKNFKEWPDEQNFCAYQEWNFVKTKIKDPKSKNGKIKKKKKEKILKLLNREALLLDVISVKTYKKLEHFRRDSLIKDRYLRLEDYLNIALKIKNKLTPYSYTYNIQDIEKEFDFSSVKLGRFSKLTRRKNLYEKYNETQIILLAQVLQKASRRMGVDPDVISSRPVITQSFEYTNENGEIENYVEKIVLDPQSQYNLARRRMRKDLVDLEAMDIFYGTKIFYNDVVMAAFETGYLTIEDIEFALRYDDLWNPSRTRFERITGFIFNITGYATFFVPYPYNVTASLGLAIIEGIVESKNRKGEDNDNPATFIQ